jgi:UDP-N-acetylmuramoyl-tripeptide--D-alanyl-D-alanine ligase
VKISIEQLYQIFLKHPNVQTDTRKLKAGELFFALKGDNFNGNRFASAALEKGAAAVVVDEDPGVNDPRLFYTDDVLVTLQDLAKHHRQQFTIPFLAITGSNGKTTTKELIHAVLSSHYNTYTTEGNLNNHIGIPLTLLKIKSDAEMAIVEMGANHQKEIESYCKYVLPTHGLINNVGKAHLEGFGGLEGVRKGKGELYDFIRKENGSIFINTDLDYLREMSSGILSRYTYGTTAADVTGVMIKESPYLTVNITNPATVGIIHTQLVGDYNVPNILAAVAVGRYFKVPDQKILVSLEDYQPSNSRSQLIKWRNNEIVLDAYNANPTSMRAAIENFAKRPGEKKVLMLGAMAELGEESITEHRLIIELIQHYTWLNVILVGGDFSKIEHPYVFFDDSEKAMHWFNKEHFDHTTFLIKGSRSSKMENIISTLTEKNT